jgi:putative Mn2+ efflux pump MntP
LAGALIGDVARTFIEAVDHWVAFGLLAIVGGKMIVEGIRGKEENVSQRTLTVGTMFLLGTATSIDAFAVGIGLGLDNPMSAVLWIVAMIAAVTIAVSLVGVYLGKRNIPVPERTANIIAGVVLIGLGVKILLEHLFFA